MPNWQPNWNDVRWNWAAAERAAGDADRAAGELDNTGSARRGFADTADIEWRGVYRERFNGQQGDAAAGSWNLAGLYRETASRIRAASQRAREEQAHREAERERWRREKEDEDQRAREARERHRREEQKAATSP